MDHKSTNLMRIGSSIFKGIPGAAKISVSFGDGGNPSP
jgi:hypothetical protein